MMRQTIRGDGSLQNLSSKALSIIAYYLSEYDIDAVISLGFKNRAQAIREISKKFNRPENYLKLRRDEFDALPFSKSHRNGWKNRKPAKDVLELGQWLQSFSFNDITELVKNLLKNEEQSLYHIREHYTERNNFENHTIDMTMNEEEIEHIINAVDKNAKIELVVTPQKKRILNVSLLNNLKMLYKGNCQLCGCKPFDIEGLDICEAHHIEYFSQSKNNDASNIIIVCPNHHRLIHKYNPSFDRNLLLFEYDNGRIEKIKINYHL